MTITRESNLVDLLEQKLKAEFNTELSIREFSAGYGIADLVFARNFNTDSGVTPRAAIVSYNAYHFWISLDGRRRYSKMQIYELIGGHSTSRARSILKTLIDNEFIVERNHKFYKNFVAKNPIRHTIAIEAKLSDHRNGLIQAKRYQYFADESYLAILKKAERNIDRSFLRSQNIGLILFDPLTNILQIEPPRRNRKNQGLVGGFAKELMLNSWSTSRD